MSKINYTEEFQRQKLNIKQRNQREFTRRISQQQQLAKFDANIIITKLNTGRKNDNLSDKLSVGNFLLINSEFDIDVDKNRQLCDVYQNHLRRSLTQSITGFIYKPIFRKINNNVYKCGAEISVIDKD